MIKPTVWIQPGAVIIYGSSLDAAPHSHHAIQLVWPASDSLCRVNEHQLLGAVLIDSQVEHQLQMSQGWVLLIEAESELGHRLAAILAGRAFYDFNLASSPVPAPKAQGDDLTRLFTPLFMALNLGTPRFAVNKHRVGDKRIQQLLTRLDLCLQGECIKPSRWRAADVAGELALSESRFLHLFRQELGIAWRPYLLWRRMMCAIQAMVGDASATEVAYLAGFSDSAHLSRTFRQTFGMTIRQAKGLFKEQ